MTLIYYTQLPQQEPEGLVEAKMSDFSETLKNRVRRLKRWQDAYSTVAGRLLLMEGLKFFGFLTGPEDVQYTDQGKPHLGHHRVKFNISHSGEFVVCALTNAGLDLGIDIEEVRNIDVSDFGSIWTAEEENEIRAQGLARFYDYWTRKEAVVKADGRGLKISLASLDVRSLEATLAGVRYFLKEVEIHHDYKAYIATTELDTSFQMLEIHTNRIYTL